MLRNKIDHEASDSLKYVAEREGFEPPDDSHRQRFSRPPHSTTLPPLR